MKTFCFGVVILGAGASSRMGRPKLLLPWGEQTILTHSLAQWHPVGARQVAVVSGPSPHPVFLELARLGKPDQCIVNPAPEQGMFSSIQAAARWRGWSEELTHFAISLGDQPHISEETLRAILEFAARFSEHICQPAFRGRAKHPVILPRSFFADLSATSAGNLRGFLESVSSDRRRIDLDDPGLELDIDTPADYEVALSQRGRQASTRKR